MLHSNATDHARHDLALIAGHAAGDLPDRDQASARALLAGCAACSDLHADLVAIAAATRVLPAAARSRDFQLSPEQASSLRRGSWLRAILRPFAATRSTVRPMAAAFSSLGVAGLLVATLLPGMLGATASAPTQRDVILGAAESAGPADANAPGPGAAAASPDTEFQVGGLKSTSQPDDQSGEGTTSAQGNTNPPVVAGADNGSVNELDAEEDHGVRRAADPSTPSLLLIASLAFLAVGLGLFGLRLAARRIR